MTVVGIVSEYNPFHLGHQYHISETKKALNPKGVIAVMSSSFVQRGAPSMFDKWTRAKMALLSGVDLVLELPVGFSLNAADYFAKGAIDTLAATGLVTHVSFGSEAGDLKTIEHQSNSETEEEKHTLRKHLQEGMSYPKAMGLLSQNTFGPNDILAASYMKAMKDTSMKPFTIKRLGDYHANRQHEPGYLSASAIREFILKGDDFSAHLPSEVSVIVKESIKSGAYVPGPEVYGDAIIARLRSMRPEILKTVSEVSEGLENRLLEASQTAVSFEELISFVKTKRYPYARLSRIFMKVFLGLSNPPKKPTYIRVLGMNATGQALLKKMKETSSLPILTKITKSDALSSDGLQMLSDEIRATDLHVLGFENPSLRTGGSDYTNSPVIL